MEMVYAAAISLDQTIHRLLHSPHRISISSSSRKKLKSVRKLLKSLKEFLESLDGHRALSYAMTHRYFDQDDYNRRVKRFRVGRSKSSERLTSVEGQIRDALHSFEDLLDSILSDKYLSLSKHRRDIKCGPSSTDLSLDLDTDEVWEEVKTLDKTVKKLMKEFERELNRLILNEDENTAEVARSSYIDSGVDMVGRSIEFNQIKYHMLQRIRPTEFAVFCIYGLIGSGRTAVARSIFESLSREASGKYFECGAWVSVGPSFKIEEIINTIISQLDDNWKDDTSKTI